MVTRSNVSLMTGLIFCILSSTTAHAESKIPITEADYSCELNQDKNQGIHIYFSPFYQGGYTENLDKPYLVVHKLDAGQTISDEQVPTLYKFNLAYQTPDKKHDLFYAQTITTHKKIRKVENGSYTKYLFSIVVEKQNGKTVAKKERYHCIKLPNSRRSSSESCQLLSSKSYHLHCNGWSKNANDRNEQ